MKNKNFLRAVAAITLSASAALGAFGLTACGGHSHSFRWESDATEHWKICDCGDEEDGTRGNHDFVDGTCECGRTEQGGQPGPGPGEEVDELSEGLKTFLGDGTGVIYQNGFTKDATVDFVTEAPATGLYGMLSGKFAENPDAANNLKIGVSGGKLNLTDVGVGAVNGYIKVETVSLKKVHIYAELEPKSDASKWNLMTVYDGAGKAIAYIRSDGNKKVGLSLDNNNVYGPTVACSGVIPVELTLDLGAGKISGKINGSPIVFAAAEGDTPAVTEGVITATSFGWLNFITADGSKEADTRNISVDNVGIKTEASDVTPAALKEKLVAQLEAKYTALNVEENYTTNGEALKEQYATDKAALQAAETNETILAAYNTAVANLDKVESDATIAKKEAELAAAKTEAIGELKAYNGGAAKYTEEGADGNKTAYDTAIANGESAINGVTIATAGGLQEAKTAVTEALNSAKTVIDGIKNDETLRAEAKAAAKEELAAYKATEIAAIDAEKFPNVIIAINTIKTDTPAEIDGAINLSEIKTLLTNAEGSIDRLIASTEQTFEEFKQAEKDALDEYATQAKQGLDATADAQLIAAIDKAATDGKAAIDAITEEQGRDDVSAAYNAAVAEIENAKSAAKLAKDKAAAKTALADYAKTLEPQIEQDPALVNALEVFVTEQQGVIDAETTTAANLAQVKQDCETAITNKVTELKATTYAITVSGADGVTVANVVYGGLVTKPANPANTATQKFVGWYKNAELTVEFSFETEKIYKATTIYAKWQEADVTVTYNVNGKIWNTVKAFSGDAATLETGVYVSGKKFVAWCEGSADGNEYTAPATWSAKTTLTLYAKLADKTNDDLSLNESWTSPATGTQEEILADNNLFTAKNADVVNAAYKTVDEAKLNNKSFTSGYSVIGNKGEQSKPIVITAKEDITLTVYAGLAASDGKGTRQGGIYYVKNNEAAVEIASSATRVRLLAYQAIELKAGDVIKLYISVPADAAYGAYMWLFGIETQLADDFTNATVTYHGYAENKVVGWNSLKNLEGSQPAEAPVHGTDAFLGWATTEGGEVVDLSTLSVAVNGNVDLYPVFEASNVTVNFYQQDGTTLISTVSGVNGKVLAGVPAAPEVEGLEFVGWREQGATENYPLDAALDLDVSSGSATLNLVACYKEKALKYTWIFTTESTTTNGAAITGCNELISIAASGSKLNNKSVTETVDGDSVTNALVTSGSGKTVTVTATKAVKVIMYMSITNSGATSVSAGNITVANAATGNGNFAVTTTDKIVAVEFTLDANVTCNITQDVSKYLAIYKIVVEEL